MLTLVVGIPDLFREYSVPKIARMLIITAAFIVANAVRIAQFVTAVDIARLPTPFLFFKCVNPAYCRCFGWSQRLSAMIAHHRTAQLFWSNEILLGLSAGQEELWSEEAGSGRRLAMAMSTALHTDHEGEAVLHFTFNNRIIYEMSFVVVPARLVGVVGDLVLLVSRVQGQKGEIVAIKSATEAMLGVAPPLLLMAAAEGVAASLGVVRIAAVCAEQQICWARSHGASSFVAAYDGFWQKLDGVPLAHGNFLFTAPLARKDLADISPAHRRRARKRRAIRHAVRKKIETAMGGAQVGSPDLNLAASRMRWRKA